MRGSILPRFVVEPMEANASRMTLSERDPPKSNDCVRSGIGFVKLISDGLLLDVGVVDVVDVVVDVVVEDEENEENRFDVMEYNLGCLIRWRSGIILFFIA